MTKNSGMSRPIAVAALAILSIILGLSMIAIECIRFLIGRDFGWSLGFLSGLTSAIGWNYAGTVLLGFLTIAIGAGLYYGFKYFWYFSLAYWVFDIILSLFFSLGSAILNLMFWLELFFVAYLLRFDVQRYFNVNIHWHW